MTRRHVRRRYRRNPAEAPATRRTARRPDRACTELDAKSFEELVQARVRKLFGASLDEIAPDPLLRHAVHDAVASGLRQPARTVPAEELELAARLREDGILLTPGSCDLRDLPTPLDLGWSLSEAIIEDRRGND
jgi:hypothetical protein